MKKGEEIVAALIFDRAVRWEEGKFRGPASLLRESSLEGYHCKEFFDNFESAKDFWENNGALRIHRHAGVEDYIFLDSTNIVTKLLFSLDSNDQPDGLSNPTPYPILKSYFELGGSWLQDVALAYRNETRNLGVRSSSTEVQSSAWTGRIVVSEIDREKVVETLRRIELQIDESSLSNIQKSDAKALIEAAQKMTDAPNPHWHHILTILASPLLANFTALIALIVAIVKN